jgi:hypothetical protein
MGRWRYLTAAARVPKAAGIRPAEPDPPPLSPFALRKHSWHMRAFISFHHFRNVGWEDAH